MANWIKKAVNPAHKGREMGTREARQKPKAKETQDAGQGKAPSAWSKEGRARFLLTVRISCTGLLRLSGFC